MTTCRSSGTLRILFYISLQDDSETNVLATLLVAQFNVIVSTTVA